MIRSFGRRDSGKRPPSLLRARLLNRRKELAFGQTSQGQTWNSRWKDYEGGRFWDTFAFQWIWPLEKVSIHPQNPPWGQRGINHRVAKRFTKLHSVIRWPCNGEPHGSKKRKNILKTVIKEDSLHGDKTCAQGSDLEDSAFGLIFCCCRLEILNTFLNKGALSFWTAPFKLFNQSRQQTEQLLKSLPRQVGFSGLGLAPLLGELCFDRKKKKKNLSIKIDHRQKCHAMFALSHLFAPSFPWWSSSRGFHFPPTCNQHSVFPALSQSKIRNQ